jgi:hypothetical protein
MFIFYLIYVIIISLLSIIFLSATALAIEILYLCFFTLTLLVILIIYGTELAKLLLKKAVLASLYLPSIIYIVYKLTIFLIEFFDKFNPPC